MSHHGVCNRPNRSKRTLTGLLLFCTGLLTGPYASADWLVTKSGARIETHGAWTVRNGQVLYTDDSGKLMCIRLSNVDIEASKAATSAGKTSEDVGKNAGTRVSKEVGKTQSQRQPRARPALVITEKDLKKLSRSRARAYIETTGAPWPKERTKLPAKVMTEAGQKHASSSTTGSPEVILYSVSWCGYCQKARSLLSSLGVKYVEKDVEKSPEAMKEFIAKAGSPGLPVIDFAGTLVRGYNADSIRYHAAKLESRSRQ